MQQKPIKNSQLIDQKISKMTKHTQQINYYVQLIYIDSSRGSLYWINKSNQPSILYKIIESIFFSNNFCVDISNVLV